MENIIQVKNLIHEIRGQKVMLDFELAELYEVETRYLNKAVKRNIERFPSDFMFQLTKEEWESLNLMFQFGTSNWGGARKLPYAFTELGAAMLSCVLGSPMAINMSKQITDTFVQLRQCALENKDIAAYGFGKLFYGTLQRQ